MIESGIRSWLIGNTTLQPLLGQAAQGDFSSSFYFSFLPKNPTLPAIILDRLKSDEADDTLDARTETPGAMMEAKFQFGSAANNDADNPVNFDGYLSAALLSRQLRLELMGLATGIAFLPDGTLIKDVRVDDEFDAHIDRGGQGYLYRRILTVTIWYVETGAAPAIPQLYETPGVPAALKNNEDVYYDQLTGNVYEQVFGAWVLVGNIPVSGGAAALPSLTYHAVAAAGINAAVIVAGAGTVTGWKIYNNSNYPVYVKLYDKATGPIVGSDIPKETVGVDAGDSDDLIGAGFVYANGIGIAIVKGIADADSTPVLAADCVVDIFYQTSVFAAPQLYEASGAPGTLHADDSIYYDLATGNVYEQVTGAWVFVGNIPLGGTEMPSTPYHKVSAASTNAANIKASAGTVTGWKVYNNSLVPIYVKLYDKATTPTPGTDTPKQTIGVDAGDSDGLIGAGYIYTTGIGIAIVRGITDADATPVALSDCVVDIFYQ